MTTPLEETSINLISPNTRIDGKMTFDRMSRIHGTLTGEVHALDGSTLVLAESGMIEGNIFGDHVFIDGFVRGDVQAKSRVTISGTGRVVGNILTPSLTVDFGAYFEGECKMPEHSGTERLKEDPSSQQRGSASSPLASSSL